MSSASLLLLSRPQKREEMKTPTTREDRLSRSALRIRSIAPFLLVWLMLSCSMVSSTRSMFGGRLPFQVTVDPDANENSAVAVDLVVVYDAKLVDKLLELSASENSELARRLIGWPASL